MITKKFISLAGIGSLFLGLFVSSNLALAAPNEETIIIPENFDPNPGANIEMRGPTDTDFKWNGVGFYDQLPLLHFNLCFELQKPINSENQVALYCTNTEPEHAFHNHYTMTPLDWEKALKAFGLGNKKFESLPLSWFVQGVYSNGTKQEIIQSQPWAVTLQ